MVSRLWASIRYSIAAKLYLVSGISVIAVAVLATASVHFAGQTRFAAQELYREGVVGIQTVTQLEVLFEQHRNSGARRTRPSSPSEHQASGRGGE